MAAAPCVTLARSRRSDGRPAKPSRWIVRLRNILEGGGALQRVDASAAFGKVVANLDRPAEVTPVKRPSPKAGPGRRPEKLYVTQIEKWLRDPYSIYARYLLGLRKWEQPGEPFSIREMGMIFHETFAKAAVQVPAFDHGALSDLFDEVARKEGLGTDNLLFWSDAISGALHWFSEFDAERRKEGRAAIIEGEGSIVIDGVNPPFELAARADRIDILNNGEAAIFDFKTGKIPTTKQEKSFSPQLPLTGLIVREGGFSPIGKSAVARYEYLKITGRKEDENKNSFARIGPDAAEAIDEAERYLGELLRTFSNEKTTYQSQPRPQFVDAYGDYDQLARRKEWGAASDDGEGDQS
ncbi:MAG: PD-(D/E)XK nuclease family protein [Parvularculaceae bacterium]